MQNPFETNHINSINGKKLAKPKSKQNVDIGNNIYHLLNHATQQISVDDGTCY